MDGYRSNYGPAFRTKGRVGPNLADVVSACFVDRTYAYIDPKTTCISLLSSNGSMRQKKMKRSLNWYFRTKPMPPSSETLEDNPYSNDTIYTASIVWDRHSSLSMNGVDSAFLDVGFERYHGKHAYYRSKREAVHAVVIRTLVKTACEWEDDGVDPLWSRRLLPDDVNEDGVRQFGGNKRDHVLLHVQGNSDRLNDKIFGFLQFRSGVRVLSVPRDTNDLTVPWQDFVFNEYPHLSRRSKLTNN